MKNDYYYLDELESELSLNVLEFSLDELELSRDEFECHYKRIWGKFEVNWHWWKVKCRTAAWRMHAVKNEDSSGV